MQLMKMKQISKELVILILTVNGFFCKLNGKLENEANDLDENYVKPVYRFGYSVYDPQTLDIKSQWEHRDGDDVKGTYSLLDPDGTMRIVEYNADKLNGFRAFIKKVPFDLKSIQPLPNLEPTLSNKPLVPPPKVILHNSPSTKPSLSSYTPSKTSNIVVNPTHSHQSSSYPSYSEKASYPSHSAEKSNYFSQGEKLSYPSHGEKSNYFSHGEKLTYPSNPEKSSYQSHGEKSNYFSHGESPNYITHGEKLSYPSHPEKSSYQSQGAKPISYQSLGDKSNYFSHGENPNYISQGEKLSYPSHGEKSSYQSHGEKLSYPSHGEKSSYPSHSEKLSYPSHYEKSSYPSNIEKSPYTTYKEKPSYTSYIENPNHSSYNGKSSSYQSYDEKSSIPSYNEKSNYATFNEYPSVTPIQSQQITNYQGNPNSYQVQPKKVHSYSTTSQEYKSLYSDEKPHPSISSNYNPIQYRNQRQVYPVYERPSYQLANRAYVFPNYRHNNMFLRPY